MNSRISRGFRLLGASWEVLRADKELLVLPLASLACMLLAAIPFIGGVVGLGVPGQGGHLSPAQWVLLGLYYIAVYAIGIFFSAAIVGAATIRLRGGDPTLGDGLRIAASHLHKILGWAVVAATVGLVLRSFEQKAGLLGRIVIAIVGAAWGAVTFLVVPVLLYEDVGVAGSVKRSAGLFRERWGEQFVGNGSIGIALFLLSLVPLGFGVAIAALGAPAIGIAIVGLSFLALMTLASAMSGIFNAALYRYATTGEVSGPFSGDDLSGAFRPRRTRRLP